MCYVIELTPHPEAAVVWGKIKSWITKDGFNVWKNEYYDEDGYLQSTENASIIKQMGDRKIPTKIEMVPTDEEGNKTIMEFIEIEYNIKIDDNFFSKQNMKRIR